MGTITKQLKRAAPAVIQSSNYQAVILYSTFADWTADDTLVSDEAVWAYAARAELGGH